MRVTLNIAGEPTPKQEEFLNATEKHVAFGGGRGAGRSWAIRHVAIKYAMEHKDAKILIVKRSFLALHHAIVDPLAMETHGYATLGLDKHSFYFPNESRIFTGCFQVDTDAAQYVQRYFDLICVDDAEDFTEFQLMFLQSCGLHVKPQMRYSVCATAGQTGYRYMKRVFVDKDYKENEAPSDYRFIRSTSLDNPFLNREYRECLSELPENMRKSYFCGDWN